MVLGRPPPYRKPFPARKELREERSVERRERPERGLRERKKGKNE
jgi:hypothetical protein